MWIFCKNIVDLSPFGMSANVDIKVGKKVDSRLRYGRPLRNISSAFDKRR